MAEKSIKQFDEKNDGQIHVSVRKTLGSLVLQHAIHF